MNLSQRYRAVGGAQQSADRSLVVVRDRLLGGTSVLKLAPWSHTERANELRDEGALLASLSHPNLLRLQHRFDGVMGLWDEGPVVGFASPWVDGDPLIRGLSAAPLSTRLVAFAEVLEAVGYLHRRGVLHLDLKPDNVWVSWRHADDAPTVTVLDLGSARPLDAGPGEAGGTLGYAAPEVLAGQAASVVADVFGLGALLYELLAGTPPFGVADGPDLRRAVMAGDYVPVRAIAPSVPAIWAHLAEQMLERRPSRRPSSVTEVLDVLVGEGVPRPSGGGEPPFVGRSAAERVLVERLSATGGSETVLVGPVGAGRRRLARRVWDGPLVGGARSAMDLTRGSGVLWALDGLASLVTESLPDIEDAAPWGRAVDAVFSTWSGPPLSLFLGSLDVSVPEQARVLGRIPALVAGGNHVVWASTAPPSASVASIELAPLDTSEVAVLGAQYGILSARVISEVVERTGGWPAAVVAALLPQERERLPQAGDGGPVCGLAPGIPAAAVDRFPPWLHSAVLALVDQGKAEWAADGRLYLPADVHAPNADDQRIVAEVLADLPLSLDPLWIGLSAANVGMVDLAIAAFAVIDPSQEARQSSWDALVRFLADHDHTPARIALAGLYEASGNLERAIEMWERVAPLSDAHHIRYVRSLRRARRLDGAERAIDERLQTSPSAALWLELARVSYARGDWATAERACAAAEALDPSLADGDALGLRIQLAGRMVARGQPPADLDRWLERVETLAQSRSLPSRTLSGAGRLLSRRGEVQRGVVLLEAAAQRADQEGDARAAAGIRLNVGNGLQRLGRGRDARRVYRDALVIAEQVRDPDLIVRLRYSLADLELQTGRLPSAEQQIAALLSDKTPPFDDETRARVHLLQARYLFARDQPADALTALAQIPPSIDSPDVRAAMSITQAQALLALSRGEEVFRVLDQVPKAPVPTVNALVASLQARAHLAVARRLLGEARGWVPAEPDPLLRFETGHVLLAAAGEDLDPQSFVTRRADLDRAAQLLRGAAAAQAATLRDRLLDGPGAALDGIVALTEAFHDPQALPAALARLVSDALGAYRVLIMVRIPGLGRQMTWTELSGAEAAGIGNEVLRRIQAPNDFWLAHNAFADPHLRQTSQTVRTFELKSLLAVAIPRGDRAVGALYVDDLHRANRFDEKDVALLQRLARAVGALLPVLQSGGQRAELDEPEDVLGILLTRPSHIEDIRYAVSMLSPHHPRNLLLTGATGVGKSVLSQRIATEVLGLKGVETVVLRRADPQMLITQLTGARRGEFTGAFDREGAIQKCIRERRALFLDEVQNLDDAGQQILLPLLEVRNRHFGGLTDTSTALKGPLHIMLGTNVDTSGVRWKEHFREDLWYRMSAIQVDLPPLAERGPEAVYRYLAAMLCEHGVPTPEEVFSTAALHRTTTGPWPGNLRQLQVFADRAAGVYRANGRALGVDDLPRLGLALDAAPAGTPAVGAGLATAMVDHVLAVLAEVDWVQKEAARRLDMTPSRLNKFLARHDLLDEVKRQRADGRGKYDE